MIFDIGYGLSAIGYLALVFLLFVGRKQGLAKYLLIAATIVTCLWSVVQIPSLALITSIGYYTLLDSIRLWIWTLFLAACLQNQFSSLWALLSRPVTLFILIAPTTSIVISSVYSVGSNIQHLVLTLVAIQMLVIVEQVYRQSAEKKWEYKPLVIYLASLTTFDFFTYANAAMTAQLNLAFFAARGYIFLCLLPFLVLAIRRIQHWGIDIFVSREVVMHSTLLFLTGLYLILMALIGYVVQYLGGDWGAPVQLALFIVAIVLLLSLFLSNEFRTKLKVFITKNFYANQFDYRVEWVALTKTLNTENNGLSDTYKIALDAWLQGLKYDEGLLLKCENQQCRVVARNTSSAPPEELIMCFVDFFAEKQWIVDCDEMRAKPEIYNKLRNRKGIINSFNFQIVLPVYQRQKLWGMVLLTADKSQRRSLNWELRDYLQAVTEQSANYIFQAESYQQLAENAQFAAFSRMSAFVVHDLKNVLAQINLLLTNAEQHKHNPEFIDDTFETLEHTKSRMDNMLKQLMQKNVDASKRLERLDVVRLIQGIIENKCSLLLPRPVLSGDESVKLMIDAEKLSNVIYNLISNAQQATKDNGSVEVKLSQNSTSVFIEIEDNGTGMTQSFIDNQLFKPFVTTKGNAGMGVGAYDAKTYIESIGGSLVVDSVVGQGSRFKMVLPNNEEMLNDE